MNKVETIKRELSVLTRGSNLEMLETYKNFPVFFGCTENPLEDDMSADMTWMIERSSGMIQLGGLLPPEILYQAQHVDGTGKTWGDFYSYFSDYILRRGVKKVLEIGGGAGKLSIEAMRQNSELSWTILEPNPLIESKGRLKVIKGFFDLNFSYEGEYDAIVLSHTLEHINDPLNFLETTRSFMSDKELLIVALPNLKVWLQNKFTNALNFEHHMYLTDYYFEYMADSVGLEIVDQEYMGDHSVIFSLKRSETKRGLTVPKRYDENKQLFRDYSDYYKKLVAELNRAVSSADGPVYLFGAHIFSVFLIYMGLDEKRIVSILDNSPIKTGKRLYGSNLRVASPKVIAEVESPTVILKVGIHRDDIYDDLFRINKKVKIIE